MLLRQAVRAGSVNRETGVNIRSPPSARPALPVIGLCARACHATRSSGNRISAKNKNVVSKLSAFSQVWDQPWEEIRMIDTYRGAGPMSTIYDSPTQAGAEPPGPYSPWPGPGGPAGFGGGPGSPRGPGHGE